MLVKNGNILIRKSSLTTDQIIEINKLGDITPYITSKVYKAKSFSILNEIPGENDSFYIVPRVYGFEKIANWNLKFEGNQLSPGDEYKYKYEFGAHEDKSKENIKLYDYQIDVLESIKKSKGLSKFGGILKLPTASGKTLLSLEIARYLGKKTMIITKTKPMANQWVEEINKYYSITIDGIVKHPNLFILSGIISMGIDNINKEIERCDYIIAVRNSLLSDDISYENFEKVGTVIIDEVHDYTGEKMIGIFNKIMRNYVIGISATPTKLNGLEYILQYYLGNIIYDYEKCYKGADIQVKAINYIPTDKKYTQIINFKEGKANAGKMDYTRTYMNLIADPTYISHVTDLISKLLKDDENAKRILVIATYKRILKKIHKVIGDKDSGLFFSMDTVEDENEMYNVTLPTKRILLAVGALAKDSLNIIDCNRLILVTPPIMHKNKNNQWNTTSLDQIIGRCIRKQWSEKEHPIVYVFGHKFNFFNNHISTRRLYFTKLCKQKLIYEEYTI